MKKITKTRHFLHWNTSQKGKLSNSGISILIASVCLITTVNINAQTAYIGDGGTGVMVINAATNAPAGFINLAYQPNGISVSSDGSKVYTAGDSAGIAGGGIVKVINTATNTVSARIPVGLSPYGIAVSADGSKVYVANQGANTVSAINAITNSVIATISVGNSPEGVSITPDGSNV